ncbi:Trpt1 [Symbiodinium natans]|uniref:2'-phosphotransferase n=1 Tax=Symbiodinium natans TaxID=878477 RepID=A0A812LCM7_9DINO|nr:Trpt1 [Symbiodinium natans]
MDAPLVTMETNPGGANDASRRPPRSRKKADGTRRRTQGEKEARSQRPDKRARAAAAAAAKGKAKAKQQAGRYSGTWEALPTTPQEWQWSEHWNTTWSSWNWRQSSTLDEQEDGQSFDWIADPNVDTAQHSSSTDHDDEGAAPLQGPSTARSSRDDAVTSRPWHLEGRHGDGRASTDPANLDHSLQGLPLETRSIFKAEDAEPALDDWAAEVQATATVVSSEDELWSETPPGRQSDRRVEALTPRRSMDDNSSGVSSPELLAEDAARRVRDTLATLPGGIRRALGQPEPGISHTGLHPPAHTGPSSSSGHVHEETSTQPPPRPAGQGKVRRETVSRALTAILRHDVDGANLLRADGFLPLHALLRLPTAKRHSLTLDEIVTECSVNEKNRFQLSDDGKAIRAVQGHSIKVQPDLLMSMLAAADMPSLLLHGTARKHYTGIYNAGLKAGGVWGSSYRQHIHLTTAFPGQRMISGMREDCELALHIDGKLAFEAGIVFYRSANGVILTEGQAGTLVCLFLRGVTLLAPNHNRLFLTDNGLLPAPLVVFREFAKLMRDGPQDRPAAYSSSQGSRSSAPGCSEHGDSRSVQNALAHPQPKRSKGATCHSLAHSTYMADKLLSVHKPLALARTEMTPWCWGLGLCALLCMLRLRATRRRKHCWLTTRIIKGDVCPIEHLRRRLAML